MARKVKLVEPEVMRASMHSVDKTSKSTQTYLILSEYQSRWLAEQLLPKRIYLRQASEFDDKYLITETDNWKLRFSGRNLVIDFERGAPFIGCSVEIKKLIKLLTISYIAEFSGASFTQFAWNLGNVLADLDDFSQGSFLEKLTNLTSQTEKKAVFFALLYSLRKLDSMDFFQEETHELDLEDKLLFLPRPKTADWSIYNEFDNIIPPETLSMISNGLHQWASKYAPKLSTKEEKLNQLDLVKKTIGREALLDCVILGLVYTTGLRPVQLSKLAVGDVFIDAGSIRITRYALSVPYAKKTRLHIDRVNISLPEEIGKLILLYQSVAELKNGSPLLPQTKNADHIVNKAICRQLQRFSPQDTQEAISAGEFYLPKYTASMFRHHLAHSMAMSGSSAEEIAYILGHSNTVVSNRYVSATPNLADIREKALGANPVFQNMITLMLTGNLIHSSQWAARKVAGHVGSRLHYHIGGCSYDEQICPFAEVRACYGCLYFRPFTDGEHHQVFDDFNQEIIDLIKLSDETGQPHHPLIPELTRRKSHVNTVILRVKMHNSSEES